MSDIKFSKEQLKAIELRDKSLMVSAAAGSGKTAVLVERIIRKITEDNVDVDKMLIVTFTNAAAQGMKRKIKVAIKECIKNDPENENLKKQLLLVDKANISTVHSFCLDLIKNYSHMLNEEVPKDFSLINETEKTLMMNQILTEIISDCYEKNEEDFISHTRYTSRLGYYPNHCPFFKEGKT
jgi:ATP-dependent helicase/nuclease subunit A